MATTVLVDNLLPFLQRSGSTPLTDDEKRHYQQEVLNLLDKTNDFREKCKIMAEAALDVDNAFDRVQVFIPGISFPFLAAAVTAAVVSLTWTVIRQVSE